MASVAKGDKVRVHYTGTLEDGSVFDSSYERELPFEVTLGSGVALPGFENAILGLSPGETVKVSIEPPEAFGDWIEELQVDLPLDQLPDDLDPKVGMVVQISVGEDSIPATIVQIEPDKILLDGNHPLAGKRLNFEIELLEVIS